MHRNGPPSLRPLHTAIALVTIVFGTQFTVLETQTTRAQDGEVVFVRPTRRAPKATPAPPPELPSRADEVEPLTFEVVTRRTPRTGPLLIERQRVSRTKDRIHLVTPRTEWLFERNPVDPRP